MRKAPENETVMIGLSIAALSLVAQLGAVTPTPMVNATVNARDLSFPSLSLPHIPMPKFRLPRFSRRNASAEALEVVARRLTALVAEEEAWYAEYASYGKQPSRLAGSDNASSEFAHVQIQVLYAGKKGWTAIASHPDAPGMNCVIYVGNRSSLPMIPRTRTDANEATAEAQPVCDR